MKDRLTSKSLLLTGLNTSDSFPLKYSGRTSFQPIGTVTGTVKLQFSNDNVNFFDLETGLDVSQPFVIETTDYYFYRFVVTIIGTGTVQWSIINTDLVYNGATNFIGLNYFVQSTSNSPADGQTVYLGGLPKGLVTTAGISKVYVLKNGIITKANIYCYSGTAGTAENWSMYIRVNNTTDYLIQTIGSATNERIFSNLNLEIPVIVGDYFEIKLINPTWVTNPLTTTFAGNILIK